MSKQWLWITWLSWFGLTGAFAQGVNDSDRVFTREAFFELVQAYHPVAKQAGLLSEQGRQNLRAARGGFDPYMYSYVSQKRYKDEEYYHLSEYGLKVPTWFGIEAKAGYNWNSGVFLNPENNVPVEGLGMVGVSMPIGQGLFIDERRAMLRQAELFRGANEFLRIEILNNLLQDAAKAYWDWALAVEQYRVFEEALQLSQFRFEGIRTSFELGDVPAIDTLEALTQVQTRNISLLDALVKEQNARLHLSTFLWYEEGVPLELEVGTQPESVKTLQVQLELPPDSVDRLIQQIRVQHPIIQRYTFKVRSLEVDRRMKREKLKPKLNLSYTLYSQGQDLAPPGELNNTYLNSNYQFGIDFSFPILNRASRGELGLNRVKLQEANLERDLKALEIANKMRGYQNELAALGEQIVVFEQATLNYGRLLDGEVIRFENGESSVFLINSREVKYIEAQNKLLELKAKYQKAVAALAWASGVLYNQ